MFHQPVALASTAADEKPKQSSAASSMRDAKKSQKKSSESKSECATKEPRSVSKKSKADENMSDDIALRYFLIFDAVKMLSTSAIRGDRLELHRLC